jgi:hypothetical protein
MNAKSGDIVDHINRNTLDNRRCNLKLVTKSENCLNHKLRKDNKCGYTGVNKQENKYRARAYVNKKCYSAASGFNIIF